MTLPQLTTPTFELEIPSTKEKIRYRPFLVKEEKVLLIAMESGEETDITYAVKDTLKNCILTEGIEVESLPSFDVEYIFLNIRGKSVGEIIELRFKHINEKNTKGEECKHIQDVNLNINDIKITFPEDHKKTITLLEEKNIGIIMKYPDITLTNKFKDTGTQVDQIFHMVSACIEKIWEGDQVYETKDYTTEEVETFLESFSTQQFQKINQFFETMPVLKHNIEYVCNGCKDTNKITLERLQDFFT